MYKKTIIFSGICILISLMLMYFARNIEGFAQWYSTSFFPILPNIFGRLYSPLPFSIFEFSMYFIILAIFFMLSKSIWLLFMNRRKWKGYILKNLSRIVCIISCFLLLFTLAGAINYSRDSFATSYGLPVQEYTEKELTKLSYLLIEDLKKYRANIDVDEKGFLDLNEVNIKKEAVSAMKNIGRKYPELSGYYPNPKPVFLSKGMSYLGITGIYSPFTLEANYNRDVASFVIPYTICHELSHLKGFMKEEEANFIAYLACRDSSSKVFKYSGTLNALIYTLNALHKNVSSEEYMTVYDQIPEQIQKELDHSRSYWQQHTASITTIAKEANDQYLIANAQVEGTKSYGKMVDLLLAEYADIIKDGELL